MPGYRCVIAGVHDGPAGSRAVEMAGLLAAETEATLVLVAAYRSALDRPADDPYQVGDAVAAEQILKAGAKRCTEMGAGYVPTFAVPGDTVTVLANAVRAHQADLLLVGNHGMSGMAGRLLRWAPAGAGNDSLCDMLVVHTTAKRWHELASRRLRQPGTGARRTVMVGLSDSPRSIRAVEQAAVVASVAGAELVLVGTHQGTVDEVVAFETVLRDRTDRARELGAESVTSVIADGDVVSGLLESVEKYRVDLLVLSDRQFADGRLLECVRTQVSYSTPTHVLLVH